MKVITLKKFKAPKYLSKILFLSLITFHFVLFTNVFFLVKYNLNNNNISKVICELFTIFLFFFKNLSIIFAEKFTTMKKQVFTLASILIASLSIAQNVSISPTGNAPDNSAALDIRDYTNKGLLIPRIALTSNTDVTTIPSPALSLLVYNTGTGGLTPAGYYYWDGSKWVRLVTMGGSPSDAWLTLGNAGTNPATHFVGTTDNTSLVFRTNNIERMRLHFGGQLSIGDNNPGGKLDVHQETSNDVARFITYGSPNDIRLRRTQGTKTSPSATSGANTILGRFFAEGYNGSSFTAAAAIEMSTDAAGGTSTDMPGRITFSTTPDGSGTLQERMRITNDGNVGIGTTSPLSKLHVEGSILNRSISGSALVRSIVENDWANHDIFVYDVGKHPAFVGLRGRGTISSPSYPQAGDVLVSFVGRDVIDGYIPSLLYGGCEITFRTSQNWNSSNKGAYIQFYTTADNTNSPTEKMRLLPDGNLCVGLTAPAASYVKIDANGWIAGRSDYGDVVYIGGDNSGNDAQMGISSAVRNNLTFWNVAQGVPNVCYANNFISTSDTTLKEDIFDIPYGLKEIMQLHPISFRYKRR